MYEKDGIIKCFIKLLEKKGFIVQEGSLQYIDILNPADEYFPECDKNSRNYYVVKMARHATERNVITIPYSTGNPKGWAYGVDNNQKLFLVIRKYLNQKTKVASAPFDIIWGHAILFTKKKR
ncbi:MAG: hypothetical protein GX236_03515 [Clostridiaceae bacterium]|jgi:hypothetical protein|nr:hypothetical protein [Clostridiaceae bacterium]